MYTNKMLPLRDLLAPYKLYIPCHFGKVAQKKHFPGILIHLFIDFTTGCGYNIYIYKRHS